MAIVEKFNKLTSSKQLLKENSVNMLFLYSKNKLSGLFKKYLILYLFSPHSGYIRFVKMCVTPRNNELGP